MTKTEYFQMMKRRLMSLAGVGAPRASWGAGLGGLPMNRPEHPNELNLEFGRAPNDNEVAKFIQQSGGYPKNLEGVTPVIKKEKKAPPPPPENPNQLLENVVASISAQQDAAQRNTLARYYQELRGREELRSRALGEVDNYGNYQRELNKEAYDDALKTEKALLASRGLANSNVIASYEQEAARKRNLADMKLSEDQSDRRVRYDAQLSDPIFDTIRARNDVGPDTSQYLDAFRQFGYASRAPEIQERPVYQPGPQGGGAPVYSARSAAAMGAGIAAQFNPAAQAQQALYNLNNPVRRGPIYSRSDSGSSNRSDQAMLDRLAREEASLAQRIRKRRDAGYQAGDAYRSMVRAAKEREKKQPGGTFSAQTGALYGAQALGGLLNGASAVAGAVPGLIGQFTEGGQVRAQFDASRQSPTKQQSLRSWLQGLAGMTPPAVPLSEEDLIRMGYDPNQTPPTIGPRVGGYYRGY